ncbi:MAG: hypoxanthine phosphoribosyltransferase [Armatimonadota bacterium]
MEVFLGEEQIAARVRELGAEISDDYKGRNLVIVGILKGSFVFLADLVRSISLPLTLDFITLSSYGGSTESSGTVRLAKDLDESVAGRDVLIVEDIVDTGWTLRMSRLKEVLLERGAASVRVCTLLDKPERRKVDVDLDYVGFVIPDEFVVGYGLDFDGLYRNLPDISIVKG